jgi:hypothetical protein
MLLALLDFVVPENENGALLTLGDCDMAGLHSELAEKLLMCVLSCSVRVAGSMQQFVHASV